MEQPASPNIIPPPPPPVPSIQNTAPAPQPNEDKTLLYCGLALVGCIAIPVVLVLGFFILGVILINPAQRIQQAQQQQLQQHQATTSAFPLH